MDKAIVRHTNGDPVRDLPQKNKKQVFYMIHRIAQAWTDPSQITASDIDRWFEVLRKAKTSIRVQVNRRNR